MKVKHVIRNAELVASSANWGGNLSLLRRLRRAAHWCSLSFVTPPRKTLFAVSLKQKFPNFSVLGRPPDLLMHCKFFSRSHGPHLGRRRTPGVGIEHFGYHGLKPLSVSKLKLLKRID